MATQNNKTNGDPPASPPKKSVSKPADPIAATGVKAGFDLMRPFRYTWGFISGTITRGLDGISNGTSKGMKLGAVMGLFLAFVAPGVLPTLMATNILWAAGVGALAGGMAGGVLGGAVGMATGGMKGVARLQRAEKYAEDLLEKQQAKKVHRRLDAPDYREHYQQHMARRDYMFDRFRQAQAENDADRRTYWQDHVHHSRSGGHGHGHGF